ncbi:hypothetical protein [Gehongia tenuis]|uniref:Uncharacterized protein n=1 Tax=Gehongia tenuis TaxID=2763655 RepID=A0A926D630_9FIRM|nr:hypothetical protein [Gehongia tenuis]MBC8532017.1 hypothetical protein [Gehongia tenuis]
MKRQENPIRISGVSLIMVLMILCLTVFAVLSLITARSEWKLAEKSVGFTKSYYEAEARSEARMAELSSVLEGQDAEGGFSALGEEYETQMTDGRLNIIFSESVTENVRLESRLTFDGGLSLESRRLVRESGNSPEENPPLWTGKDDNP